jgi:hypothetical protein
MAATTSSEFYYYEAVILRTHKTGADYHNIQNIHFVSTQMIRASTNPNTAELGYKAMKWTEYFVSL